MESFKSKIDTFTSSRSPKNTFKSSRSINPEFPHVSKFDDVTRYNSANFNVYFYKDYPNRSGTPIKTEKKERPVGYRKSVSPEKQKVMRLLDNGLSVPDHVRDEIAKTALNAVLRSDTEPPKVVKVSPGPATSTMNDFHKRETNAGYARNGSGGYYTR